MISVTSTHLGRYRYHPGSHSSLEWTDSMHSTTYRIFLCHSCDAVFKSDANLRRQQDEKDDRLKQSCCNLGVVSASLTASHVPFATSPRSCITEAKVDPDLPTLSVPKTPRRLQVAC